MAEYSASQITIANGSKAVVINSGESPENVRQGDFLFVTGSDPVAINRTYINDNGQHVIELTKNWGQGNKNNQPAIVLPSTAEYKTVADALKNANLLVNDNFVAMQDWQTKTGTVTFVNIDGTTTTVKTLKQIESEAQAQLDAYHPYPWAMRKVEFEARRAANNEKFAASGFVHFGQHYLKTPYYNYIGEGLYTGYPTENYANQIRLGREILESGVSKQSFAEINIAGITTEIYQLSGTETVGSASIIKLPPAEDGTRTYDSATGISVTHATPAIAFASETDTNKVVTERVDMWGLEAFLREINDADPFVYKNGLIQSLAADIDGVTTVTDNVRPDTYFAWYEGDDSSTGKGVNWQTATEAQRTAIASNPENNIYFDDATGKFYQWCVRGRSFAGVGNGDWEELSVSGVSALTPKKNVNMYLHAQGGINAITSYGSPSTYFIPPNDSGKRTDKSKLGHWTGQGSALQLSVIEGHCYFLICGTVNRLNKGAYHPSFNPLGSSASVSKADNGNVRGSFWYEVNIPYTDKSDCFNRQNYDEPNAVPGYYGDTGSISSTSSLASARPDSKLYDAIYASGQGGVCRDMRYSAWGLTQEDFAEADLAIKSGEYRGHEGEVTTRILKPESAPTIQVVDSHTFRVIVSGFTGLTGSDRERIKALYLEMPEGEYVGSSVVTPYSGDNRFVDIIVEDTAGMAQYNGNIVVTIENLTSIADEYTHTEVIGNPSNILLCEDLKDGWVGSWNPQSLPSSEFNSIKLTHKCVHTGKLNINYTSDQGGTWVAASISYDSEKNSSGAITNADEVRIYNYKTKAKMTESSVNSAIYGDETGIGDVYFGKFHNEVRGGLLGYDLTGKVITSGNDITHGCSKLKRYSLRPEGKLDVGVAYLPIHTELSINAPTNDSSAFKTLNYNVEENQQGFINYAYTELKYDGDWGDDGKIHITDNQATRLDDNGNSVVYGTARIVEPLGWIKNDK